MKILLYNIAYGTGNPGGELRRVFSGHHYLAAPERPFRKIERFVSGCDPDVVCLVETDSGSRRTGKRDQAGALAEKLGYSCFSRPKYAPDSLLNRLPYWKSQSNAILSRAAAEEASAAFFPCGWKRLILCARIGDVTIVLVHLALGRRTRRTQLEYLAEVLPRDRPLVVAGDFNTFGGNDELAPLLNRTNLRSANAAGRPSYPAWAPERELDYLLISPELDVVDFRIAPIRFSDHLPLYLEIAPAPVKGSE